MKKVLSLLVCLLGLTAFASARNLKGASAGGQCDLTFYGPTPDPVCNTYIDENGEEQTECYQVGPSASRTIVDGTTPNFTDANGSAYEVDFSGDCNCKLVLYTKANFKGKSFTYPFSKSDGAIFANQVWNKDNASYKIVCRF